MWEQRTLYFAVFTNYAATGSDLKFLFLNQWSQFVDDCGLADNRSKALRKSDLDRLFIAVDTQAALTRQAFQKGGCPSSPKTRRPLGERMPPIIRSDAHAQNKLGHEACEHPAEGSTIGGDAAAPSSAGMHHANGREAAASERASPAPSSMAISGRATPPPGSTAITHHVHDDLKKKALGRVEFLLALVHVAVLRYVLPKRVPDVSEALLRLLTKDIAPLLNPAVFCSPSAWREQFLYVEPIDKVLRRYENTLRHLFNSLCRVGGSGDKARHLGLEEWKGFCRALELLAADVTERCAWRLRHASPDVDTASPCATLI